MLRRFSINKLRWPIRLPVKWMLFALALLAVCFPYPDRLIAHLYHIRNLDALVQPNAPALEPLVDRLRPSLTNDLPPQEALRRVERFVYEEIPYEWDWNTWGTADYLPTVTEAIEMGKEDCDGRAVVAASLLRRFGFKADLVTDYSHMWVQTDHGETMSPGGKKAVVITDQGIEFDPTALSEIPRALMLGIAVFPLSRELILLTALLALMWRSNVPVYWHLASLALFACALTWIRMTGNTAEPTASGIAWAGVAILTSGFIPSLAAGRWKSPQTGQNEQTAATRT